jgi:hypothetical protein
MTYPAGLAFRTGRGRVSSTSRPERPQIQRLSTTLIRRVSCNYGKAWPPLPNVSSSLIKLI